LDASHEHEQYELLKAALNLAEREFETAKNNQKSKSKFELLQGVREALIEKIFEAEVMAREVQ
jgi:hypothetical protein